MKTFSTTLILALSFFFLNAQESIILDNTNYTFSWDGNVETVIFQSSLYRSIEQTHFTTVWTGVGYEQMNINVVLATLDEVNLETGDEVAVFDGNLCVGVGKLFDPIDSQHILTIIASMDDGSDNGYTPGNPIIFKYWDASAGVEISLVTAYFYSNKPEWSATGNFEIKGTSFVDLVGLALKTQTINLTSGWNYISFYLSPEDPDMMALFQPLILDGSLVKIQDEAGNSLEDLGQLGGWTNNIGPVTMRKGYRVKVAKDCQLVIQGYPYSLPVEIPLSVGWNIMGFPRKAEAESLPIVQPMIDRNTLVKVQDGRGFTIEDYDIFGGWKDNIGHFKPGEGYKVRVTTDEQVSIPESNLPPGHPHNPSPADSSLLWTFTPTLSWECSDPDGYTLTYDVYLGITSDAMTLVGNDLSSPQLIVSESLEYGMTYYWKVVVKDSKGNITEGLVWEFMISNETLTFTDSRDGKVYKTVKIGDQTWMAENLAYLPVVSGPSTGSQTEPFMYVYDYDGIDVEAAKATANYSTYGVLYNWPAALTACPSGWHLPSDAEWTTLTDYLINNGYGYEGSGDDIAKSMAATTNWDYSLTPGTPGNDPASNNSSGFMGLPSGRQYYGSSEVGRYVYWWSSKEYSVDQAWIQPLYYDPAQFAYRNYLIKEVGISVRCVKDL